MSNAELIAEARRKATQRPDSAKLSALVLMLAEALERSDAKITKTWDDGYVQALRDHDCNGRSEQTMNPHA